MVGITIVDAKIPSGGTALWHWLTVDCFCVSRCKVFEYGHKIKTKFVKERTRDGKKFL